MNLSTLSFWSNLLGWSAVTLTGLGAAAGSLAWYFNVQKDAAKDAIDSEFRLDSATKIAAADLRAAEANKKAEDARQETAKHELELVVQRKELAAASERAARAEARAVESKVELEKYRAPRMLKPAQEEAFVTAISEFNGQRVFVGAIADTAEASSLGVQLYLAFGRAGLNVEGRGPYVKRVVRVARGVVVRHVTGNDKALRLAIVIAKSLNDSGIMATRMGSLDEEVVERMEKEQGMSRNHENWEHVAVAIGDKP